MLFIAKTKIAYFSYEYIDFGPSGIEWHKVARFGAVIILHIFAKKTVKRVRIRLRLWTIGMPN